jgi:hypothetical protein
MYGVFYKGLHVSDSVKQWWISINKYKGMYLTESNVQPLYFGDWDPKSSVLERSNSCTAAPTVMN